MAEQTLRVNLSANLFPFATELGGRSIIIPGIDQNYDRTTLNAPGVTVDKGIPQAFYMHNCLPTSQGYQSVGYKKLLDGILSQDFDNIFTLQNPNGDKFLFCPAAGKNFVFDANVGHWVSCSPIYPGTLEDNVLVTTAYIHGETYIFYEKYGCFRYSSVDKEMHPVNLISLNIPDILGICASNGYMIAFTKNSIAWSSLTDPTNFFPDLASGSGGGSLNEIRGDIVVCLTISGGFIAYCTQNAVSAKYSGNVNFPFITKEIPGSSGIISSDQVSWQANLPDHYVFSGNGIQQVDLAAAKLLYPEAADFVSGKIFEDFNETTLEFSSEYLSTPVRTKLVIIAARFLVLSYGKNYPDYTHALVFDLLLNRWGKLKLTHRDCFQWNFPNRYGALTYGDLSNVTFGDLSFTSYRDLNTRIITSDIYKESFAFVQADGTVYRVNFEFSEVTATGVLALGKFQLTRGNYVEHQAMELETIGQDNEFKYYIYPTWDGKTLRTAIPGFASSSGPKIRMFRKFVHAYNFVSLFIGKFNATSAILSVTQGATIQ